MPEIIKKREDKWVGNFQKYSSLDSTKDDNDKPAKDKRTDRRSEMNLTNTTDHHAASLERLPQDHRCRRVTEDILPEELILLGKYHLDEDDLEVYKSFVSLLTKFNKFEKVKTMSYRFMIISTTFRNKPSNLSHN